MRMVRFVLSYIGVPLTSFLIFALFLFSETAGLNEPAENTGLMSTDAFLELGALRTLKSIGYSLT